MRIGSLFSGAGMLDVAATEVFPGAAVAWHAEIDPAASRVLAHHWPHVPNFGDVTEIDWATVPPVEILTGGFPCQDVSAAGKRAGLGLGTRSGLWSHMRDAIEVIGPRWVLIENVRGLLNARAIREVESKSDVVGDGASRPVLRAIGAVLGDLADIGYDAQWTSLRASAVGACHRRERVFILAHPADPDRTRSQRRSESAGPRTGRTTTHGGQQHLARHSAPDVADAQGGRLERLDDGTGRAQARRGRERDIARSAGGAPGSVTAFLPTPSVADGTGGHVTRSGDRQGEMLLGGLARAHADGALMPTPRASDGTKGSPGQHGSSGDLMLPSAVQRLLPTPNASDGTGGGVHPDTREGHTNQLIDYAVLHNSPRWGQYESAIGRQEALSRPAPSPTEPNAKGNPRLSTRFAEWMMFWPLGHVTDPALALTRIEQLRIIGNGVVVPQAIAAGRHLRTMCEVAA
ncbi:DNA cytosine methyltransferase [Nocardia sp. CA-128927]|uniref:DNA cytosine methyltransferase n=1 Tax=Nocardia sp. CA-128927 TaxID=3239975 RepID=UPI003D977ABB